jgi:ATP-dependent exoDNAse (exonuclease V) beta subunit
LKSVTNVDGALAKPALSPAAGKRAGERAVFQEMEWHAIQQEKGDEEARKWISAAPREYMQFAQNLGSAVHFCCEVFDEHVTAEPEFVAFDDYLINYVMEHWVTPMSKYRDTPAKNLELIRKHVEQYDRACKENGITFLDRERTVCSPEHGYAGTLDGIVEMDGRTYVLDIKTGFVSTESVPLQLAAYRFASHEVHGDHTTKRTAWVQGGLVLQLKPASYKLLPVRCDVDVFTAFLDVKRAWEWQNGMSKTAIGEEWL